MTKGLPIAIFVLVTLMAAGVAGSARADGNDQLEQDRARTAMLNGEVAPLVEVIKHVESLYTGTILEVELEEDETGFWSRDGNGPTLLYEIKLLTPQGNVVKLELHAKTLELLTVDGHDSERARTDESYWVDDDESKDREKD